MKLKDNLDYLCEELSDAVLSWDSQAKRTRQNAKFYRERGNDMAAVAADSAAEVCEAHADTLRRLVHEYADEDGS